MRYEKLPEARLVSAKYAAAMLSVSSRTIYMLVEQGDLPGLRVGRCVRIPLDGLLAFVDSWKDDLPPTG
jgi:excisionase family DNA binding protein